MSVGVQIIHADSRIALRDMADHSIDSVVCDPPYALVSIVKRYGKTSMEREGTNEKRARDGSDQLARLTRGFMGKAWDNGDTAFDPAFWEEVLRVMKPGAHLIAFSGTRTYHRLACAIEDAGFEIRDQLAWAYGSGFPKSHDVSKAIDRAAWAEREVVVAGVRSAARPSAPGQSGDKAYRLNADASVTAPATPDASQWQGWGTALKPAWEPIVLARKSLIGTIAANVLEHGTGALNIDACRIHGEDAQGGAYTVKRLKPGATLGKTGGNWRPEEGGVEYHGEMKPGRWPANLIHDGSEEVLETFPQSNGQAGAVTGKEPSSKTRNVLGLYNDRATAEPRGDSGSAARFFYSAKADADDRLKSKHPTVKPVDVMAWLVKLITPPGGVCLDPFAGSGTTGMACLREGFDCILIEREAEYIKDIEYRLAHVKGEDLPLFSADETSQPADLFSAEPA